MVSGGLFFINVKMFLTVADRRRWTDGSKDKNKSTDTSLDKRAFFLIILDS